MYYFFRKILFLFDPEIVHYFVFSLLKLFNFIGLLNLFKSHKKDIKLVFGLNFKNRIGVAAGLDKNGEYIEILDKFGFGFIEIGTVTPRPQKGNSKPRLFRLVEQDALINRFGFNNLGIDKVLENVKHSNYSAILGINIGKNFDTEINNAVDDYLICFRKAYKIADYICVNISSPNTKNLRDLQSENHLNLLIKHLKAEQSKLKKLHQKYTPFLVKISPDLEPINLDIICKILIDNNVDGIIATNTTIDRQDILSSKHHKESGGLSGQPLKNKSTSVLKYISKKLQGKVKIIGVGGISSYEDAKEKFDSGADLVQIYTGLIYKGLGLIDEIHRGIQQEK
jgi:dihydroorotate dehydrogenase